MHIDNHLLSEIKILDVIIIKMWLFRKEMFVHDSYGVFAKQHELKMYKYKKNTQTEVVKVFNTIATTLFNFR